MKPQYYETCKFKASLVALLLSLAGTAALLYFTVTECLQECSRNSFLPTPCLHEGKSYCCLGPAAQDCLECEEESSYCTEFIVGSGACFILAVVSLLYLCMVRRVALNNLERSNWSGMASMATYKEDHASDAESNSYRRQK